MRAFTRQLGSQPGIQLNPIQDRTDAALLGVFDQTAALPGRFMRGRIDKPFRVNRGTLKTLLGKPASINLSALNEAYVQGYECLQRGARELLVWRLTTSAAALSYAVFVTGAASAFSVSAAIPGAAHTFSVKHLGCHNDGIIVAVHADKKLVAGVPVANDIVTVKVYDADSLELYSIKGSLTAGSTDEWSQSNYLPDVSDLLTDLLVWSIPVGQTIAPTDDCYGKNVSGVDKWATSAVLSTFSEGGTAYVTADYDAAVAGLRDAQADFGYIMGGGTRSVTFIGKLADLAYDTNRQFVFDVPGDLTVTGAIAFAASMGFGSLGKDHYPQAYWAPLKSLDPVNGNRVILGTSGAQVGYRCARNALTNAYGLAPKNQPIAGINGNVGRAGTVTQLITPSEQDLSDLADAHINPVLFQTFSGGSFYAYTDSLTSAKSVLSYRKLISVAEMSSHLDESVARFGRECLHLPMATSIQRMKDYLEKLFTYAQASGWLIDSTEIPAFRYTVARNAIQTADRMDVNYWLHFDGTTRQVHIQQSIV